MVKIWLLFAALIMALSPARACSLLEGAFLQSNYEVVDSADAIVIGTAVRRLRLPGMEDTVTFRVDEVLKGKAPKYVRGNGSLRAVEPSDPNELTAAHPESYAGPCVRRSFASGGRYVLMLEERDGELRLGGETFRRNAEDDYGPQSNWRRAVALYLDIQSNPDRMAQLRRIEKLVEEGRARGATDFEARLAHDLALHAEIYRRLAGQARPA